MEKEIEIIYEKRNRTREKYSVEDTEKRENKRIRTLKKERNEIREKLKTANYKYEKSEESHAYSLVKLLKLKIVMRELEEENKDLRKKIRQIRTEEANDEVTQTVVEELNELREIESGQKKMQYPYP